MSNHQNYSVPYRSAWPGSSSVSQHAAEFSHPQQPYTSLDDPERRLCRAVTVADSRIDVSRPKEATAASSALEQQSYPTYSETQPASASSDCLKLPSLSGRMHERDPHPHQYFSTGPVMVHAGTLSRITQAFPATPSEEEADGSSARAEGDEDGDGDVLDGEEEQDFSVMTPAERLAAKRRMKRFRLTHQQTRFLMSEFGKQPHPDAAHRERLSREIPGLSPRQVQVWFQNRRAKIKRMTVDDRERMLRMRTVPDDFDNVRALHSPYGAVRGLNVDVMPGQAPMASSLYEPRALQTDLIEAPLLLTESAPSTYVGHASENMIGARPAQMDPAHNAGRTGGGFQYSHSLPRIWEQHAAPLADYRRNYSSSMTDPQGSQAEQQQQQLSISGLGLRARDALLRPGYEHSRLHQRGYSGLSEPFMRSSLPASSTNLMGRGESLANSVGGYRGGGGGGLGPGEGYSAYSSPGSSNPAISPMLWTDNHSNRPSSAALPLTADFPSQLRPSNHAFSLQQSSDRKREESGEARVNVSWMYGQSQTLPQLTGPKSRTFSSLNSRDGTASSTSQ